MELFLSELWSMGMYLQRRFEWLFHIWLKCRK